MRIHEGLTGLKALPAGSVLSIGNFDGIHRGHQKLLQKGRELCRESGAASLVVATFEPHPTTVLRPDKVPPRITPLHLKHGLLAEAGVDDLVLLPPAREVLDITAEEFWQIIRDDVRPRHMIEGRSFSFGKGRGGTVQKLQEWSAGSSVQLHILEPFEAVLLNMAVVSVSSSLVRWLLRNGRVRDAAICLGRGYELEGEVVKGHQRGRALGVPTANLRCGEQVVPADGVYAGRCAIDGAVYPAAVSIGTLPTFGDSARQIEAHLVGFNGDLYGQTLRLELIDWGRDQWKFPGVEALKSQIDRDIAETMLKAADDPSRPIAAA